MSEENLNQSRRMDDQRENFTMLSATNRFLAAVMVRIKQLEERDPGIRTFEAHFLRNEIPNLKRRIRKLRHELRHPDR